MTELAALLITLILTSPVFYMCYDVIKDYFVGDVTPYDVWLFNSGLTSVSDIAIADNNEVLNES